MAVFVGRFWIETLLIIEVAVAVFFECSVSKCKLLPRFTVAFCRLRLLKFDQ